MKALFLLLVLLVPVAAFAEPPALSVRAEDWDDPPPLTPSEQTAAAKWCITNKPPKGLTDKTDIAIACAFRVAEYNQMRRENWDVAQYNKALIENNERLGEIRRLKSTVILPSVR